MELFILITVTFLLGLIFGVLISDSASIRWIVFIRDKEDFVKIMEQK